MQSQETTCGNVLEPARIGAGQAGMPGQGPHMIIVVKAQQAQITQARFSTYGCPAAVACGQYVCEEIEGSTLDRADSIDEESILKAIGQMPLGREHCPGLAVTALRSALEQIKCSDVQEKGKTQCP